jgi:hypothetical protein
MEPGTRSYEARQPTGDIPVSNRVLREPEMPPAAKSENAIRAIIIRQLNRGYVVEVGCQTFAIGTSGELISKLTEYISEPEKTEKKWFNKELF